jgi:hypothetical protein
MNIAGMVIGIVVLMPLIRRFGMKYLLIQKAVPVKAVGIF